MTFRRGLPLSILLVAAVLVIPGIFTACCDLSIETDRLPPGRVGVEYGFEMESDCGGGFWFLVEGTLPPGIAFTDEGEFSGRPTEAGTFPMTIGLEDFDGSVVVKGFSLTINDIN